MGEGLPSFASHTLSTPGLNISRQSLWNLLEHEWSESARGTRLSCPERKELQEEGSGQGIKCHSNLREDGEWGEAPGLEIRGL